MQDPRESPPLIVPKTRRDMLHLTTGAFAALGAGALVWPLLGHMQPAGDRRGLIIDLSEIVEGQQLEIRWQRNAVFIRHRTLTEINAAQSALMTDLRDKETDDSRLATGVDGMKDPRFIVLVGSCPHCRCILVGEKGDCGGWYCPCHGSHFDTSGRIRRGPSHKNMAVPRYQYVSATSIEFLFLDRLHFK